MVRGIAALAALAVAAAACDRSSPPASAPYDATAGPSGWEKIYDHPADSATSIDMLDDDFGLAVIGHSLQQTGDGGRSWQEVHSVPDDVDDAVAADRLHWWIFGPPGTMLRTDDGGTTWRPQSLGTTAPLNRFSVVNTDEAWATAYLAPIQGFPPHGESALLRTVDGGDTWTREGIPGYGIYLGNWFIGSDGWVIATQCRPGDPTGPPEDPRTPFVPPCEDVRTLLHTSDSGGSWEIVASEPGFVPQDIVRVDRDTAFGRCAASNCDANLLYASTDGGRTWSRRAGFDTYVESLRFLNEEEGWVGLVRCRASARATCELAGSYEHTTDGGLTWESLGGIDAKHRGLFDVSSYVVAAVPGTTGISYYDPGSRRWRPSSTDAAPEPKGIAFTSRDAGYAWAVGVTQLSTDDGGETWGNRGDDLWWSAVPPGVLARWYTKEPIRISDDDGRSWRDVPPPPETRFSGWVVAAVGDRIWVQQNGTPWRTDDAGQTWRRIVPFGEAEYHFIDEQHGWIVPGDRTGAGKLIHLTADGGETWQKSQLPHEASDFVFRTPLEGWAATSGRSDCLCVIATRDGGESWETVSTAPWHLDAILPTDDGRLWGVARLADASVVVTSADGGATWHEDLRVDGAHSMNLVARDGRLWFYYSTTAIGGADGPNDPPRRTVIYRRQVSP